MQSRFDSIASQDFVLGHIDILYRFLSKISHFLSLSNFFHAFNRLFLLNIQLLRREGEHSEATVAFRLYTRRSSCRFSANLSRLVFTDYFLQLSTLMPTDLVYGLGEQWTSLRRSVDWRRYYLFTRDGWPRVRQSVARFLATFAQC